MLNKNNSILLAVDIQEKLVDMLGENSVKASDKSLKIITAADILSVDTVITEQYPKGLGQTIQSVREFLGEKYKPFEKTSFSAVKEVEIFDFIKKKNKHQIILFGIESHICVFQTAVELKEKGFEVYVVEDISFSRNEAEKILAMQNLRHFGIQTLSLETILFMWLESSKDRNFKAIQALIK